MMQRFWQWLVRYRIIVLIALFALVVVSAGAVWIFRSQHPGKGQGQVIPVKNNPPDGSTNVSSAAIGIGSGETQPISIHLSEGKSQPQVATPMAVATGEPLSAGEIGQLLARLPEITAQPEDQTDFRLAQQPIPPPRAGETIQQPFPAPTTLAPAGAVESGPLKVLRFAPEGEIAIAPFLSVTFNQPMVPVATVSDLAAADAPVKIEPALQGTWRWLGTRTLTFEYDSNLIDRLPKATSYHITVPAGTKSATGGTLEASVEWSFTTPPPQVTTFYPQNEPQPREPLFFVHFDQRVDPAAVLQTIQVMAGGQKASLALVDEAALKADEKHQYLLKSAQPGRWLAFKVKEPLPADTDVQVSIGPGTPSAEGPLTTQEAQTFSFHTYAPLKIEDHGCSWGNNECVPLAPLFIRFNNPIDTKAYSESMIRIDPELPGASVNIYGNTINIQGATKGHTTYTVTVDANIQDTFGQKLGQEARLTFKVGAAEARLIGPDQALITLDPASKKPVLSVYSINYTKLDLSIYAVQPSDWPAFRKYMQDFQRADNTGKIPGKQVLNKSIPVEAPADTLTEVNIDLSQVMDGPFGHFIVVVAPPTGLFKNKQDAYYQTVQVWAQVTQIGLDAHTDQSDMVAWTTGLKDGSPLANVKIKAENGAEAASGPDGTARFSIPSGATYLVASQGADQALLPHSAYFWDENGWMQQPISDELRWYVYDDRQMYKPGEEVHVKGWLRRIGGKQNGDVGPVGSAVSGVNYQIMDAQGNAIGSGRADVNALGGFDFVFTVPTQVNLGYANLVLNAEGSLGGMSVQQCYHNFQIQEFRRPEFEVTARNESSGPYFAGESATVAVDAKYYAGGGLPNADVTWQVTSSTSQYSPPNWPDFTFGTWTPWWGWGGRGGKSDVMMAADVYGGPIGPGGLGGAKVETFTGKTDANGTHYLQLDFGSEAGPHPVSVVAEASVMDVNRQAWAGTTTLLVHPANLYVGLRSDRLFVQRGTPLKIQFIVTDLDGKPVGDRQVQIQAARLEWKYRDGNWKEEEADPQQCLQGSTDKPGECTFNTPVGGTYRITAVVTDDQGRKNQSQLTRWVSGGNQPPERDVKQEALTLIPDKQNYQPGDVAEILVQSPFSTGEGLLTLTRNGIVSTERFSLKEGSTTLKIPIEESYIPNLNVRVDVNGAAPRTDDAGNPLADTPARPAFASGDLTLQIPPAQRTLAVKLTPEQSELEPGGETTLAVQVNDAAGRPVSGAEMSVVVVDEAILALTNYEQANPLDTFYSNRPSYLQSIYSRSSIILANPLALSQNQTTAAPAATQAMQKSARDSAGRAMESAAGAMPAAAAPMAANAMADQAANGAAGQPIKIRSDFNPLAVFAPSVRTDENGAASVTIKLPDNLTRYRVIVVAVDEARKFGQAETNLTARLPLMVRPSAPRFLNFGDKFELPVVLQNQTDQPMDVNVAVRGSNIDLTGATGLRVTVPARDRLEVRFPAAAQMAGTARFQIAATAGDYADAATVELPVYTPATTEAFATYGVIDQGAVAQPVASPQGVFAQYGGLEITTSSTALQSLTDAVLYLVSYPYECSEQLSSRILAVASLRDVLTAFKAEGLPSAGEMESAVARDLQLLRTIQNDDGGFPYWRKGQESIPFNTIHAAHALYAAKAKGFSVPEDMQQRTLEYLRAIETHYPSWYGENTRNTLSAYALYVRHLMGDSDPEKALKLYNQAGLEKLSLDAIGWLWPVMKDYPAAAQQVDAIRTFVNNHAVETAGAANFTTAYDDQNYLLLGSSRRTDAILLDALITDNPQYDLIPKVVTGLLAHRTKGHWMNTQEDVFVLLALDRYFNTFEAQTPDFVAQIWLGQTYAGSHEYRGRTTERQETNVPMSYLVDPAQGGGGGTQDLILSKEGAGRLYYRLGLRYAPTSLKMDPLDMGFIVQRKYEALDNPEDVKRDADGTWHIKAGARVRVSLTMVANNRRYHVALTDPLPAGLEIVNPSLAVSGSVPQDPTSPQAKYGWWWWGTWYEHQNLRDERAEAFASLLWDGVYQYSYVARATTPGTFVAPPAKAEEMYSPETFGRSGSDIVIVE